MQTQPDFVKPSSKILRVPFVPSSENSINTMLEIANLKPGEKMADLGSGDGRIILAFAENGAIAYGYEIDGALVIKAETRIYDEGLDQRAFIHWADYWEEDLSEYDIVTIFGISYIMEELGEKLKKELKPGAKVISNVFTFPNWKPKQIINNIHLYIVP